MLCSLARQSKEPRVASQIQPEDGLSKVMHDLRERYYLDVRSSIAVILTRPVRLAYVGSDTNNNADDPTLLNSY